VVSQKYCLEGAIPKGRAIFEWKNGEKLKNCNRRGLLEILSPLSIGDS